MNIWIIHHYANSPDVAGDARHFSHARELISLGHKVRIIACSFQHLTHQDMLGNSTAKWEHRVCDGVPFTWLRTRGYAKNSLERILNMFAFSLHLVRRNWVSGLESPDLIMGSTPHPFAALAAERLAGRYKIPFVLEVRDVWPFVLTEVGGHSKYHPFVLLVDRTMRFLYKRASAIVMFSQHSTQLLARYGADPNKIIWIPHGVDLTMVPAPLCPPDDGVFTISYIGAHNQWNALDNVLDAAIIIQNAGIKHVQIRFVGSGDCKASLIARSKCENIHNVRFDDPVPKKKIGGILHNSDAFIINNREDEVSRSWMSFNKLYEYLAAGRPVIFGSCMEDNPVRESGAGITVRAGNPKAIAAAIQSLAECTNQQREEYGRLGRAYIEDNYSISVLANRFEKMARGIVVTESRQKYDKGDTVHV